MDSGQKNNIFPSGIIPQKSQKPENDFLEMPEKQKSGNSDVSASTFHIPYKVVACRMSRNVHLPKSEVMLHIPALPEESIRKSFLTQRNTSSPESICISKVQEKNSIRVVLPSINIPNIPKKPITSLSLPIAIPFTQKTTTKEAISPSKISAQIFIPVITKKDLGSSVISKHLPVPHVFKVVAPSVFMSSQKISAINSNQKLCASKILMGSQKIPVRERIPEYRNIPLATGKKSISLRIKVDRILVQNTFQNPVSVEHILREIRAEFFALSRMPSGELPEKNSTLRMPLPVTEKRKRSNPFSRLFSAKKKSSQKKRKEKGAIAEVIKFGVTTGVIFVISFAVMNASALSELLSARLDPVAAIQKQIALQNIVAKKNYAPILPKAGMKGENRASFPPLNIKVGPIENRVVIPKIGKNVPVVDVPGDALAKGDWNRLEDDIQNSLKGGVVHYPGTASPGQVGNVFITGHSSYYLWDQGKYKDVFVRLHDLEIGDEFTIFWNQNTYHYRIRERKVVSPEETSVLKQPLNERIATLMTCTPIGTAKDRLVLIADQI